MAASRVWRHPALIGFAGAVATHSLSASLHVASLNPLDLLILAAGHNCRADFAGWLGCQGSFMPDRDVVVYHLHWADWFIIRLLACPQATPPSGSNIAG